MTQQHFAEQVIQIVSLIPYGRVTTYGAIAKCIGTGASARLVGYVLGHSLQGKMEVPAHRVVNASGLLTGKHAFETPQTMQQRLEAEGVAVVNDKVQHFSALFWNPATAL
ncbi:cysteine methyltransferase [bacterium]|nr:cysteine methyltransferase [bacterium]